MADANNLINEVDALIAKGEAALRTHRPNPPGVIGFPTLDSGAFAEWREQSVVFLQRALGAGHQYADSFQKNVQREYQSSVKTGLGILRAFREDTEAGRTSSSVQIDALATVNLLCARFHLVASQLRSRHEDRATLDVSDEYDVQDLLHALLKIHFEDVRPEEWTPSYAGKSSRMDFLLKKEQMVVEVKKTRPKLADKEVGTQLIEDIARYRQYPNCRTLVCFVYDPEGRIINPRGIENDLSTNDSSFVVHVIVAPRGYLVLSRRAVHPPEAALGSAGHRIGYDSPSQFSSE